MLITKECDYAVRVLRALAKSSILTVQEISQEEMIPPQYAYKICHKLSKSGAVKSRRGSSGGYELVADPSQVSLFDVFVAMDADLQVSNCSQQAFCARNNDVHVCKVHREFCRLQNLINQELQTKKLSELL